MKEYEEWALKIIVFDESGVFCGGSMDDAQTGGSIGDDDDIFP